MKRLRFSKIALSIAISAFAFGAFGAPVIVSPADYAEIKTVSDRIWNDIHSDTYLNEATFYQGTETSAFRKNAAADVSTNSIPIRLQWVGSKGTSTVKLYRTRDLEKSAAAEPLYTAQTEGNAITYFDPEVGRNYTWTVTDSTGATATGHFYTMQRTPRVIYEDQNPYAPGGEASVGRDIGGWLTADGTKRVQQGLLYRSAQLEFCSARNNEEIYVPLTHLQDNLKIRLEVDLRQGADHLVLYGFTSTNGWQGAWTGWKCAWNERGYLLIDESSIGPGIRRYCVDYYAPGQFPSYNSLFSQDKYKASFWMGFYELYNSIKKGEPALFHCSHGKDRTGALAYILLGSLGVSETDCRRDFGFTWYSDAKNDVFMNGSGQSYVMGYLGLNNIKSKLDAYSDSNFQEDCIAYLKECCAKAVASGKYNGSSDAAAVIAEFQSLMLEDVETKAVVTKVAKPIGNSFSYTGAELVGIPDDERYTITGVSKAIDIGSYTATLALKSGYTWEDGTTANLNVAWSITDLVAGSGIVRNAISDVGYTVTGLGKSGDEVAVVFTNCFNAYTWKVPKDLKYVKYLVVGGGGGGGGRAAFATSEYEGGAGGGGGGVVAGSIFSLKAGDMVTVNVGAGGRGGDKSNSYEGNTGKGAASSGSDSSFKVNGENYVTAFGGGGDAGHGKAGAQGGSNAGNRGAVTTAQSYTAAGEIASGAASLLSYAMYGNKGGIGVADAYRAAAGGGGAAEAGGNARKLSDTSYAAGGGGAGIVCDITGTRAVYGSGGGGGATSKIEIGYAGKGGEGAGDGAIKGVGTDGLPNQGGGGGGGALTDDSDIEATGGNGGSGIVVLRYSMNVQPEAETPVIASETKLFITYGDSVTRGAGAIEITMDDRKTYFGGRLKGVANVPESYPYWLSGMLNENYNIINQSRGETLACHVSSLFGAQEVSVNTAITLPKSGSATLNKKLVFNNCTYGNELEALPVKTALEGFVPPIYPLSENYTAGTTSDSIVGTLGGYRVRIQGDDVTSLKVTALDTLAADVTIPAGSVFIPESATVDEYKNAVKIVCMGGNDWLGNRNGDYGDEDPYVYTYKTHIRPLALKLKSEGGKYLIVSPLFNPDGSNSGGDVASDEPNEVEKLYAADFGENYFNLRLAAVQNIERLAKELDIKINGDWSDFGGSIIKSDCVHLTSAGYKIKAALIRDKLVSLGYITEVVKPVFTAEFAYDGSVKQCVPTGAGYAISGVNEASEIGEYKVLVTPEPGRVWTDGTTDPIEVTWTIAQLSAGGESFVLKVDAADGKLASGLGEGENEYAAIFTTSGKNIEWEVPTDLVNVQFLVVGGGGGGGAIVNASQGVGQGGAGGGGGGVVTGIVSSLSRGQKINIYVGNGGAGGKVDIAENIWESTGVDPDGTGTTYGPGAAFPGEDSYFKVDGVEYVLAYGGAGDYGVGKSSTGGSNSGNRTTVAQSNPTKGKIGEDASDNILNHEIFGNKGGLITSSTPNAAGGGGGASEAGGNAKYSSKNQIGGEGGEGVVSTINGSEVVYGSGGGGGFYGPIVTGNQGGFGKGGGTGAGTGNGSSAKANQGGGGGGGTTYPKNPSEGGDPLDWKPDTIVGGNGGSGIVVLRFSIPGADEKLKVAEIEGLIKNYDYDGLEHSCGLSATDVRYTLSGVTKATEVGTYTVTVTVKDGWVWNDNNPELSRSFTWKIAQSVNEWVTEPSISKTAWDAGANVTYSIGSPKSGTPVTVTIKKDSAAFSGTLATIKDWEPGFYSITFSVAETSGYTALSKTLTVNVTDPNEEIGEVTIDNKWGYITKPTENEYILVFTNHTATTMKWTAPAALQNVQFLVVGGGGGGGADGRTVSSSSGGGTGGGGGGGGGVVTGLVNFAKGSVINVTVGKGGTGGKKNVATRGITFVGNDGKTYTALGDSGKAGDSSFSVGGNVYVKAYAGGGDLGAAKDTNSMSNAPEDGGSGSGARWKYRYGTEDVQSSATKGFALDDTSLIPYYKTFGNKGGANTINYVAAGGGGATKAGGDTSSKEVSTAKGLRDERYAGAGGEGLKSSITGTAVVYGSGGGGGSGIADYKTDKQSTTEIYLGTGKGALGGTGAGNGNQTVGGAGTSAKPNQGGGGGGGGLLNNGGSGGSGIVVFRFTVDAGQTEEPEEELIAVAKPVVTETSFTYDGSAKSVVASNAGYTLVGNATATEAGNYTVTIKLNEGYVWSDNSTDDIVIDWTIAAVEEPFEPGVVQLGGNYGYVVPNVGGNANEYAVVFTNENAGTISWRAPADLENVEFLVVGGGGGGGASTEDALGGGGGGGGCVVTGILKNVSLDSSILIKVGSGTKGGTYTTGKTDKVGAAQGSTVDKNASYFLINGTTNVIAYCGGREMGWRSSVSNTSGGYGGSNAGSRNQTSNPNYPDGRPAYVNSANMLCYKSLQNGGGVAYADNPAAAGGGGGAISKGSDSYTNDDGRNGGNGGEGLVSDITGTRVVYGSGGGGGTTRSCKTYWTGSAYTTESMPGLGGEGAGNGGSYGGTEYKDTMNPGKNALANQGGGGGGGGNKANGGNGGSGIVVLRFSLEEEGETPEVPPVPASDWSEKPSLSKKIFNAGTAITVFNGTCENRTITANYTADQIAAFNPGTYTFRATASAAGVEPLVYEIDFWVLPADFSAANTIVCYGDSITYGDGAAKITIDDRGNYFDGRLKGENIKANYPYYLAGMIDTKYDVIAQAKPQQWSDTILAWAGGVDVVTRNTLTLPASGSTVWAPTNLVFTAANPYGINGGLQYVRDIEYPNVQTNYFAGAQMPALPAIETRPNPAGSASSMTGWLGDKRVRVYGKTAHPEFYDGATTADYAPDQEWARISADGSSVEIPAGTPFVPDTALVYNDAISVIFTGTNDEMGKKYWPENNAKDHTTYINMIADTVAKIPSGRYVVVSTLSINQRSDEIESAFAAEFGEHHLNLYKLMELYGLKTAVKLGIMTQAQADATTWNTKTTGLMNESVHPNEKGYQVIAYFIKQKLIELNYIEGERDTDISFSYVDKPTVDVMSFTYDGTEKVVIAEGENYTLTGTAKAINAGSYTVIITPNAGFGWSDGTIGAITINWTIEKTSVEPGQPDVGGGENPEVGSNLTIVSPADYSTVSTMSENLKSIIQSANMLKTSTFATAGTDTRKMYNNEYCTNSLPVKLEWTGNAASYTVSVYRTRDIESGDAKALYSVTTSENSILYWDPEVGRNYTWTVDDGSSVAVGHFYTLSGVPRLIYADKNGPEGPGIDCLNGRDLGGWATTDGKVVKQSMIYRSAELETCNPTNSIGVRTEMPYLADILGIKLDIDLRKTNEVLDTYLDYSLYYSAWKDLEISNISPDIPRYSAHLNAQSSFPSYEEAIIPNSTATEKKRANIWKVFEQFTIEDNYPIIFHCAHGKDRAGTVGYILLSVLGVPADNAKRDFGLSWLYYVDEPMIEGFGYTPIDAAVQNFPSYGGNTLKEQCENYLVVCARDAGVTESVAREKIAKFRSLMLEEPETQIASSASETVTYTWTGNGGDNNWTNPANWASPEDSYGYPNAENAVVYFDSEVIANIDLGGSIYKAKPIFGDMCDVAFVNGTLNVVADSFTLGAADATVTLNADAKIVASGALKILGTLNVVIPEGGRDLPISAASLAADTASKINLDLTDFSAAGEVTIASFGEAFDSAAALEYTFTVAGNTVANRGTITTPESKAIVYSQDKKTGVIALPDAVTGLVYTGSELVGVLSGEGYTLSGDYKATDAGTYTAQVVLKDGYSFRDATDGKVVWTIAKADNGWAQIPSITIAEWNIGEAPGVLTSGATKFGIVSATISKDGGEAQAFDGELPMTKGNYVITYLASGEGTDNYNAIPAADLTKSVSFTITANPSDLTAYAGYVTYPEPIFFVNGIMKLGEGTTTAKIKYSVNSEACNNVKEVTVDKDGYFRVNIPYENATDTLTWEVEVVNSASSDVLTVAKSTIKRAHDPSRVTYKWRGKGANNNWRSLANWEGFSGTVGNNNPCCWGFPGYYNAAWVSHVHFDQSTGPEGIDLEGQTYASIDNGFFVFEENVFVKMKNGTLIIPGGYTTFENETVGLIGAKGSTLVLNNVKFNYIVGSDVTKYLTPASGFTLVYEGNNTVDWYYWPQNANSKFVVRNGTLSGNSFSTKTIAGTHVVEISNGVWSVTKNISNAKGIGAKVIFRDGPDREAQFITTGSLKMYGTYDIKIPATGKTKPAVEAATLASCSSSKIVLDVTDYKSATKVPLVKFTSKTVQTAPTSTLEAYADGVNVTSERGAKLTFEDNILYYSQNEVKDPVVLEKIEKPEYATTSFTYDGDEKVVVAEGENYTITGTAKATNAGSYTATITPNEGYAWADETTDAITINWSIAKATNEWTTEPSISLTEWTQGETAGVLTAGVAKFGDVAVTINGEEFAQMPTAVGTYAITYSVADSANYSALTKTVSFTIKAAPVDPEPEEPGTGGDEGEGEEPKLEIDSAVGYIVRDLGELKDQVAVVFTNANNYAWTMPKSAKNVEFLVVGGGGGGAGAVNGGSNNTQQGGAGGGGGAVVTGFVKSLNISDILTITVGEGGDNGTGGSSTATGTGSAISGGTSSFAVGGISYITAYGGGGGGGYNTAAVAVGGSNSGGTKSSADTALATVTYIGADAAANIYGAQLLRNKGGVSYTSSSGYSCGGGGGGAATVGLPSTGSNIGGKGGSGFVSAITGESLTYGAGGGGGIGKNGGDSSDADDSAGHGIALKDGTSALANQGGGGGGGSYGKDGGDGGSGIIVLRFAYSDKDVVVDVEANVKSKISSKAYTGSTLTSGVINTYAYSVEELTDDLVNIGKKTVRVTLNDGYVWSDGDSNKSKEFGWYIAEVEPMENGYKVVGLGEKGNEVARVYTNHTATINWTVPANLKNVQFLVVGGGGGGGADNVTYNEHYQAGGGGGGGGVVTGFVNLNKDEIVSIKIGIGGKGGVRADKIAPYGAVKSQAENSFIKVGTTTVTANGGGGDPGSTEADSTSDGAQIGGIGGSSSGSRSGATGRGEATRGKVEDSDGKVVSYTAFGNQGGAGASSYRAGGGGGATTEGKAASDVFGGAGGEGLACDITGTMVVYGSGGGGGAVNSGALGAGLGGTGAGNGGFTTVATSALANQGGGGGGGGRVGNGGNGGSGIVVFRYVLQPDVNGTPISPEKVFDEARVSKEITYPSAPSLTGEEGSQVITWRDVRCVVPEYYTATLNDNVISLKLNTFARPIICETGENKGDAIVVSDKTVTIGIINTKVGLFYSIEAYDEPACAANPISVTDPVSVDGETAVLTIDKPEVEGKVLDSAFFKVVVTDENQQK